MFDDILFCHNCSSLSVAKSYEELHHLEEDSCCADVDKSHEVVYQKVSGDSSHSQYKENDVQDVSYFIRFHQASALSIVDNLIF